MDLRDLEVFHAVATEGGVTRASEKLGRVQSSITTRVKQLEAELGVPLFLREGKRMHVSPSGKVLLNYAERLLALAGEARSSVQEPKPAGPFRLGAMESTAAVRLPRVLTEFHRLHPEIDLKLRTGNPLQLSRAILDDELDAALFAGPVADARFDKKPAFEESLVLISGLGHPPITIDEPPADAIIVFENGCPHRRQLERWFEAAKDIPNRVIELGSYHAMFGSVVAGMGVALLPESVLAAFPDRESVQVHRLGGELGALTTYLVWRKGAHSLKIQLLCERITACT